jgi:DNA processing protein
MEQHRYLLALSCLPGMTRRRLRAILEHTRSEERAWKSLAELPKRLFGTGNPEDRRAAWLKCAREWDFSAEAARLEARGIRLLARGDPFYPEPLSCTFDPPELLFVQGDLPVDARACVALVGSRKATAYGKGVAAALARGLIAADVAVVSGAAYGIDCAAHRGALEAGGPTVAVLGCGLDIVYPPQHKTLYREISERGCLITEYPLGARPLRQHFPERNRIIAGLSQAVVVVEAAAKSGALITADFALEEGRDVWAVPGQPGNPLTVSPHRLIQEGAWLCTCAQDILNDIRFPPERHSRLVLPGAPGSRPSLGMRLGSHDKLVLAALTEQELYLDDLAELTCLQWGELFEILTRLRIAGLVQDSGGSRFRRVPWELN